MPFKVRLWSKPNTQTFIKRLRAAGYRVDKVNGKYECWNLEAIDGGDELVFTALPGSRGYLCRVNEKYVNEYTDSVRGE